MAVSKSQPTKNTATTSKVTTATTATKTNKPAPISATREEVNKLTNTVNALTSEVANLKAQLKAVQTNNSDSSNSDNKNNSDDNLEKLVSVIKKWAARDGHYNLTNSINRTSL